jgi:hypothetical protein
MRVNKAIHELAKSYLHHVLSWIRCDINWGTFIIDLRWAGVDYILLDYVNLPKSLLRAPLTSSVRSTPQQAPPGRLHVRIDFPPATSPAQIEMVNYVKNNTHMTMYILVLEKELAGFMMILQTNDVTYCHRFHPGALLAPKVRAVPGISSEITIAPDLKTKRYKQMLEDVATLQGELHKTKVTVHEDNGYATSVIHRTQREDRDTPRLQIPTAQVTSDLSMAAMSRSVTFLMWLKNRGDDYLMQGMYSSATMCYNSVCDMEMFWLKTSPLPEQEIFWTLTGAIYTAFGAALAINVAIAHMAGDAHRSGAVRVRGWEEEYDEDRSCDLSLDLGRVYETVQRLVGPNKDKISMSEGLEGLKIAARSVATTSPLKWAASESMFSRGIQHDLSFLATVKVLPGTVVESVKGYVFGICAFNPSTEEGLQNGEDEMRYLM